MKYLVDSIAKLVMKNSPDVAGETMIRVDGFEQIEIYEAVSRKICENYSDSKLTINIKLAKNKWRYFKNISKNTSVVQSMLNKGWVAEKESITYYRNLHDQNILLMLGTEDEEDKGGLLNCYTITPDTLVSDLRQEYHKVFVGIDSVLSESDCEIVDKMYRDLFEFIPIDICKLSDIADEWEKSISNFDDFKERFYDALPQWGLPFKREEVPSTNLIKGKKNILKQEYDFISRQLFKRLTGNQYKNYCKKISLYEERKEKYSSEWGGWDAQGIKSYSEFADLVKGYIRGENVEGYKKLLLKTDFNIVEAVLGLKLETTKKEKNITTIVNGDPLTSFTKALLWILSEAKANDVDIATVKFEFNFAEVISMYSEMEDEEEEQQLLKTWQVICRHVNGLIEYLNRAAWNLYGNEVEIISGPSDFFDPQKAKKYIEDGLIKAASSNKTINKILFHLVCLNSQGEIVQEQFSCEREKDFVREFQWRFINSCSWLHNFSDICENDIELNKSYIPIAILPKIKSLMFAKSEEEFFDLYDESDIDFKFNLIDLINAKKTEVPEIIAAEFNDLGTKFTKFILEVTNEGFYKCILKDNSELIVFVEAYRKLGKMLTGQTWPENVKWILDAYIHAFNIENSEKIATGSEDSRCCIVPAWHPAALEKLNDQNLFILDGSKEWWNSEENDDIQIISGKRIEEVVNDLSQMSMIQSALDIFPSYGQVYFGAVNSFGAFSTYGRDDIENNSRLKDMIHKDAIYDDDFDSKENVEMNDNAKMIYDVIEDYNKAFPDSYRNLSVVFVNPSELQPIIAAIYKYIDVVRKKNPDKQMNINIKILVKPENKGGRNYLAYWMDECFSQDSNVNIHTYLNEWRNNNELDKILNGNNDIVFAMNLLKVNCYGFVQENGNIKFDLSQCRFPIVFKPAPISDTSSKVKRRIELSQPQFRASYTHTQVTRYRNNGEVKPISNYIAVREVCIDDEEKNTVSMLHEKAYWVVCVDSGMDGALLRNDDGHKDDYSIIGFSTGKGAYGQYNLTITARKIILETIKKKLSRRLYQLFMWDTEKIKLAASICIKEASGLDGISLFSAINQKDRNINEFMAYVLTSLREKEAGTQAALKIVVHLDSLFFFVHYSQRSLILSHL